MTTDFLLRAENATFSNAVKAIIGRTCLIEFGVIKKVIASGVVQVAVSVAKSSSDVRILTCVLISPCSTSFAINFIPKENDKVLVFFPRRFNADMFSTNKTDIIEDENGEGFTPFSGLAILVNQFRSDYKNTLTVDNGDITVTTEKASVHIDTSGNIEVDAKDGKITLKNSKASLFDILDSILTTLNSTLSTSGSPAKHIVDPNQFQQEATDLSNLMQ